MKKQKKNISGVLLLLFALISCGKVEIKNSEWCGDIGDLGATCFNTLSSDVRELSKEEWEAERFGQLCTTAKSFAEIKSAIEKLCYLTKSCTYEEKKLLKNLGFKIEKFNKESNDFAITTLKP